MPRTLWGEIEGSTNRAGLDEQEERLIIIEAQFGKRTKQEPPEDWWRDFPDNRSVMEEPFGRRAITIVEKPHLAASRFIGVTVGLRAARLGLLVGGAKSSGFHFTQSDMDYMHEAEEAFSTSEDRQHQLRAYGSEAVLLAASDRIFGSMGETAAGYAKLLGTGVAARAELLPVPETAHA